MLPICNHGVSSSGTFMRLGGLAACALLAAACHGGVDLPTSPSVPPAAAQPVMSGDEAGSVDAGAVASTRSAPDDHPVNEVNASGYSGTCTLATARSGFRLKAQGTGIPGTVVRFHLITADGFGSTMFGEVNKSGAFRTGQDLITFFTPNTEVKCRFFSLEDTLLAESTTFTTP